MSGPEPATPNAPGPRQPWTLLLLAILPIAALVFLVIFALDPSGSKKPDSLKDWVEHFHKGNAAQREEAVQAVTDRIGPRALLDGKAYRKPDFNEVGDRAVPLLLEIIGKKHKDAQVRYHAIGILSTMDAPLTKDAVPALTKALDDEDSSVQRIAASVLGTIGADSKASITGLVKMLRGKDANSRMHAFGNLRRMGPAPVPALVELLKDEPNKFVRTSAIMILEDIGPAAKEAIPQLRKTAESDPDEGVRDQARIAVKRIGG